MNSTAFWKYLLIALFVLPFLSVTQTRPSFLDLESDIIQVGSAKKGVALPLVVFFPYTTADAARFYEWVKDYQPWDNYIAIIPQGVTQREHYLPDFWSFIQWYEKRILADIGRAKSLYSIDTNRIYMQGFSLGGDLGWAFMIRHKKLFAGAYINGSRCSYPATEKDLKYLKQQGKKIVLSIGKQDASDRKAGMAKAAQKLENGGVLYRHFEFEGGHSITSPSLYKENLKWMTE